jgi:hypothetical protein
MSDSCPNAIAGVAYLKVDGTQYALKGNLTISIGPFARTGVAGLDGVHGYTEQPRVPFISAEFSDIGGMSLVALQAVCNSTITTELINGKVYLLRNAWTSDAQELNGAEGTVTVKFEGLKGEEIMP